jgi:hypothetical protein
MKQSINSLERDLGSCGDVLAKSGFALFADLAHLNE